MRAPPTWLPEGPGCYWFQPVLLVLGDASISSGHPQTSPSVLHRSQVRKLTRNMDLIAQSHTANQQSPELNQAGPVAPKPPCNPRSPGLLTLPELLP